MRMANLGHMFVRGRRMAGVWAVAAVALALTTACTPDAAPTPSPSPTGFASEEEAFAAAEEAYRAYVDALNKVDLSDPETFEPVFALTTGDARNAARKSFSQMSADGWTVNGESVVILTEPAGVDTELREVSLAICVDVSNVTLVDRGGQSQVGDRPDRQSLLAVVVPLDDHWAIQSFEGRDGEPSCGL